MQPSGITLEALRFKSAKLQCVAHVGVLFHLTENPPPPFIESGQEGTCGSVPLAESGLFSIRLEPAMQTIKMLKTLM